MSATPTHSSRASGSLGRDWLLVSVLSLALLAVAGGALWWNNVAFPAGAGHSHSHGRATLSPSVGEPGDPALPARVVEVAMMETDGGMKFEPAAIEVTRGDQVRFKLANRGLLDHEFVLATLEDNLEHLELMKTEPDMVHVGPNSVTLAPDAKGEILWRFTEAGTFDFSCLIPGHREAGMHGSVTVR
jgi:uncharacterized cupredoxin-like copper-binding protein